MIRTLAAAAVGLALAVAPIATAPAQALDERQAAGIIAGAAILGLGAAMAQNGKGKVNVQVYSGQSNRGFRGTRRHATRALPGNCLQNLNTRRGTYSLLGQNCLARSGVNLSQLPRRCESDVRVGGRTGRVYGARCLQQYGWRVARRHH